MNIFNPIYIQLFQPNGKKNSHANFFFSVTRVFLLRYMRGGRLATTISRPSHLGILVLRLLCVLKFPILEDKTIFKKSGHGHKIWMY